MLVVKDITVKVDKKILLQDFSLKIKKGEVHVLMGPNGAGKSTFSKVIAGYPFYKVCKGSIFYENEDLLKMSIEERAKKGIFVSFQHPTEIENISNGEFLCAAYNARWGTSLTLEKFKKEVLKERVEESFLKRGINTSFSGGEKKKNEILQMELLDPNLVILDEIDSGLDVDALKDIAKRIKIFQKEKSIILITHYQRILEYISFDYVHILDNGKIVKKGKGELAEEIFKKGYKNIL